MMQPAELAVLAVGGFAAGIVNTLAGGGSLITVGLLVFLGLPGTIANGTNRVGVLVQNLTSAWRFRAEGLSGFRTAVPVLIPVLAGSVLGAWAISRVTPEMFEQLFGVVMLLLLIPVLRPTGPRGSNGTDADETSPEGAPASDRSWPAPVRFAVFFAIGLYGGAIQAGVGIFLLFALSRAGHGLVFGNSIKVVVIGALTAIAVPVFVLADQIDWPAAVALAVGFGLGGVVGVRLAVLGGERIIKPVLVVAVVALAARMLGIF